MKFIDDDDDEEVSFKMHIDQENVIEKCNKMRVLTEIGLLIELRLQKQNNGEAYVNLFVFVLNTDRQVTRRENLVYQMNMDIDE